MIIMILPNLKNKVLLQGKPFCENSESDVVQVAEVVQVAYLAATGELPPLGPPQCLNVRRVFPNIKKHWVIGPKTSKV